MYTALLTIDLGPLWLTFKLAIITTALLFILGIPLAYWLAYAKSKARFVVETLVSMPLVLPPTVIGFYLLIAFSPSGSFGIWLDQWLDLRLVFTFEGLIVGSIIYSLPFMVQPIRSGFVALPENLMEASDLLGKSRLTTLRYVLLPNIKSSLLTAAVLTFAHTIGEFGVVLMIGGSIPDVTKVASIAIYEEVESLNYATANDYSVILFVLTFLMLLLLNLSNGGYFKGLWKW